MALFKDLFSKKKENPNKAPETQNELIRVYDNYGREIQISREDWRNNVLLGNLQKAWDKPNELYDLIVSALRDGFIEDTLKPSKRLYEIDPDKERATVILGIVYLQNDQINKAENILSEYIKTQGESGIVLTNLAKVYAAQKKEDLSRQTLWHALELDPNQDNAVEWYASIFHEEGGFKKYQEALSRLTQISGSWRAQLWLARNHLENKDLESAIVLYKESLGNAETPTPIDLLKQMSGDLGNNGHLPAILELCAPSFDPAFHGLEVGNNLIKANLDLGCIEPAQKVLADLFSQNRPDWKETLSFWDNEISKIDTDSRSHMIEEESFESTIFNIKGPIWLRELSPTGEFLPTKDENAAVICCLGASAEQKQSGDKPQLQMADVVGRLSRAIPLFLNEQIYLKTDAIATTMVPWILKPQNSFLLSGKPWPVADAAAFSLQGELKADYVILTHLLANAVQLTFIRSIDGKALEEVKIPLSIENPTSCLISLSEQALTFSKSHADITEASSPLIYQVPQELIFPYYLLGIEQTLAISIASIADIGKEFLHGERDIVNGLLQLCLEEPKNPTARLLLFQALKQLNPISSEVVAEFLEKISSLQEDYPIEEPVNGVANRMLRELSTKK